LNVLKLVHYVRHSGDNIEDIASVPLGTSEQKENIQNKGQTTNTHTKQRASKSIQSLDIIFVLQRFVSDDD
jgi:hypothetical protein